MHNHPASSLATLFHRRWTVPVLAEVGRSRGARFVTLSRRLGISSGALRQTLDAAIADGWIKRNPGYGHPLRPEYILTDVGAALASPCGRLVGLGQRLEAGETLGRKWSAPILASAGDGPCRFADLRRALPRATDRALAQTLKRLGDDDLLIRAVGEEHPPRPRYSLTPRARHLSPTLDELCRVMGPGRSHQAGQRIHESGFKPGDP